MTAKKSTKRPSPRVARKRERSRQEILEAAQSILRNGGVEAVTLASVAGELGLTKPALYHYFPSKEALVRTLVVSLLDDEIEALTAAINAEKSDDHVLGAMIRAFYEHYIRHLEAFRAVYCQAQLYDSHAVIIDEQVLREEINPRTRGLFDLLEERLSRNATKAERARCRQIASSAWLAALGLMTMLGVADAANDPLVHTDESLLESLTRIFDGTIQAG